MKNKLKTNMYVSPQVEVIVIGMQTVLCGSNLGSNTESFNDGGTFSIPNP